MSYPIVLSIAGHDPVGGAGIQADIEAIGANGCRAATVPTCLTIQDTAGVEAVIPVESDLIRRQLEAIGADIRISAVKIGLIGSAEIARTIAQALDRFEGIPVILDPVLASGGGTSLADDDLLKTMLDQLLPRTTLLTPNSLEARRLASTTDLGACPLKLLARGVQNLLITGTHEEGKQVVNTLYRIDSPPLSHPWPRLQGEFHGSGCTLASSIAANLARGMGIEEAVYQGQLYTWDTLAHAYRPGRGQALPDRLFRCNGDTVR